MANHLLTRSAVLLVLFLHLIVLANGNYEGSMTSRAAQDLTEQVDAFVEDQMARHHLPGLALVITQGSSVLYSQGYGSSGDQTPITPQTQFYLASVSKSMTALAVMQLVEEGEVDLDAPVQRYLPEFTTRDAAASARVTVRHLLNHTSGMTDTGFPELRLPQMHTSAERVRSLRGARRGVPLLQSQLRNPGAAGRSGERAALRKVFAGACVRAARHGGYISR